MAENIWAQLEADFDKRPQGEITLPEDLEPEAKGYTPGERLKQWALSGVSTVFASVLISLALLYWEGITTSLGLEFLLAALVIWIARPALFPGTKPSTAILICSPLFVGWLMEVLSAGTQLLEVILRDHEAKELHLPALLQVHLISFFSPLHLVIYTLIGFGIWLYIRKSERELAWMDPKPPNKFHLWLSRLLVFIFPLLTVTVGVVFALQHPWSEAESQFLEAHGRARPASYDLIWHKTPRVTEMDNLVQALPWRDRYGYKGPEMSALQVEKRILELLPEVLGAEDALENTYLIRVFDALSKHPDKLKTPHLLGLAALSHPTWGDAMYEGGRDRLVEDGLIPWLAKVPLSELKNRLELEQIQNEHRDFLGRLDRRVESEVWDQTELEVRRFAYRHPELASHSFEFVGITLNFSIPDLITRRVIRDDFRWWLQFREDLKAYKITELEKLHRKLTEFGPGYVETRQVRSFRRLAAFHMRPNRPYHRLSGLVCLIIEMRRYRDENGDWPNSIREFALEKNLYLAEGVTFNHSTGELTYIYEANDREEVAKSWVLK